MTFKKPWVCDTCHQIIDSKYRRLEKRIEWRDHNEGRWHTVTVAHVCIDCAQVDYDSLKPPPAPQGSLL